MNTLSRRTLTTLLLCSTVAGFLTLANAGAQSYPSRPITLVLPFAAGGPTDVLARILAEHMRVSLGQPVRVENIVGAAGTISLAHVARAAPDGYTLSFGPGTSHVITAALYPSPIDLRDLQPVALIADNPSVIVSRTSAPAADLKEFISWVLANPTKLSAGTSGVGAMTHIAGVLFQQLTHTRFAFVPYRGAGPAMQDLIAGQIDLMIDQMSNVIGPLQSGKIRGYAVASPRRATVAPDLPTVDELGLTNFHLSVWHGLWAPKGTPEAIVATINRAVAGALADDAVRTRFAEIGQQIYPAHQQTPAALAALQKAEIEKWWPIIKGAGIQAD